MTIPIEATTDRAAKLTELQRHFHRVWGKPTTGRSFLVSVPLRLCPLGAHSDHQGGTVTGFTINRSIDLLAQVDEHPVASVYSATFNQARAVRFEAVPDKTPGDWVNYLHGAIRALSATGVALDRGFRGVVHGPMPIGGLSSSAAVTIAYLKALEHVNSLSLTSAEGINLVRAVENGYLGLHNGILDQSVILSGKRGSLVCIDCSSQKIALAGQGAQSQPWEALVVYSGLSRQLTATPFNERVAECHEAARQLLQMAGRETPDKPLLAEAGRELFDGFGDKLPPVLARRARHFFTEAARVAEGIKLWTCGDMVAFGKLITASGESSIINYESGSPPLISLYEILAGIPGVYGTRFCGGGFQGCCLALIDPNKRSSIAQSLHQEYTRRHPELAASYSLHLCQSNDSVSVEPLS